jgi:hypothetical protein
MAYLSTNTSQHSANKFNKSSYGAVISSD